MKRRNLLKMIGLSPALMVPWKPATEKIVGPTPAPIEPPRKLSLDEALSLVDWDELNLPKSNQVHVSTGPGTSEWKVIPYAVVNSLTGCSGLPLWGGDDGTV